VYGDGSQTRSICYVADLVRLHTAPEGTTIRFYDPKMDRWLATWNDPVYVAFQPLVGHVAGSEIVMEGTTKDDHKIRWIFSEIKPDSFRWHGEKLIGTEYFDEILNVSSLEFCHTRNLCLWVLGFDLHGTNRPCRSNVED